MTLSFGEMKNFRSTAVMVMSELHISLFRVPHQHFRCRTDAKENIAGQNVISHEIRLHFSSNTFWVSVSSPPTSVASAVIRSVRQYSQYSSNEFHLRHMKMFTFLCFFRSFAALIPSIRMDWRERNRKSGRVEWKIIKNMVLPLFHDVADFANTFFCLHLPPFHRFPPMAGFAHKAWDVEKVFELQVNGDLSDVSCCWLNFSLHSFGSVGDGRLVSDNVCNF